MSASFGPALTPSERHATAASPRRRDGVIRAVTLAFIGTPIITTICFFVVYAVAASSPTAPSGDTGFAWVPLIYPLIVGPAFALIVLVGIVPLVRRPPDPVGVVGAWVLVAACVLAVLWIFVRFPAWGGLEGFPTDTAVVVADGVGILVSLLPATQLARWLAQHRRSSCDETPA